LANDFLGGTAIGTGCSNGATQDPGTHFCEDAFISFPLTAGTYFLTLSEQGNDGPGFLVSPPSIGVGEFPLPPGSNFSPGPFNDPGAFPGTFTRSGQWALLVTVDGTVDQTGGVPEPATLVLSSIGALAFALTLAKRRKPTATDGSNERIA
jgi:hypothetical protein